MDDRARAVLDVYHARMRDEETMRQAGPPRGGLEGGLDRMLLAVGPDTGHRTLAN